MSFWPPDQGGLGSGVVLTVKGSGTWKLTHDIGRHGAVTASLWVLQVIDCPHSETGKDPVAGLRLYCVGARRLLEWTGHCVLQGLAKCVTLISRHLIEEL